LRMDYHRGRRISDAKRDIVAQRLQGKFGIHIPSRSPFSTKGLLTSYRVLEISDYHNHQ
jgi:hypothetical protein